MLVLVTGVIDDARGVPAFPKFLIHFTAAFLLVVPGGAQIETLGNILGMGEFRLGWASIPFSIACVVYIINAINMMDGLDGLAGGLGLIILFWLMAACGVSNWWEAFNEIALLAGALAGFLYYNMRHPFRKRAAVFLGDAGSMALGLTIAWFCIGLSQGDHPVVAPVSVAWIIALPIIDAFGLLVARLKEGKHPFHPDRRHFHHHFLNAGFSVGQATGWILLLGACLGAIGFFGPMLGIPEGVLGWVWVALWIGHAGLVMKPEPFVRLLVRLRGTQDGSETQP
jgi:UDP-GlcNAc:undecaprenyl-phosphate GlcNAc-1-phosphate transferase